MRRLGPVPRGGLHFGSTHCSVPSPGVAVSLLSSGSQGVGLLQRQMKSSRKVSLLLTLLQSFSGQDASAPWPLGAPQVSVLAETRLTPILCCGACPFNSCEQLICLSLSQSFPPSRCPSYPNLPAILFTSPAKPPWAGAAPFIAFCLKPHDFQASAFFRALDFKKLQFWSSVVK